MGWNMEVRTKFYAQQTILYVLISKGEYRNLSAVEILHLYLLYKSVQNVMHIIPFIYYYQQF